MLIEESFDEYKLRKAVNWSVLKHMRRSPAHALAVYKNPRPESRGMVVGSAQHVLTLEPAMFKEQYAVAPDFQWNSNAAKEAAFRAFTDARLLPTDANPYAVLKLKKDEVLPFLSEHSGKTLIERGEYDSLVAMSAALWNHTTAKNILKKLTVTEETLQWEDEESGVVCKARLDGYSHELNTLVDLKTTDNGSYGAFQRTMANFDYIGQMAFYKRGLNRLEYRVDACVFIVVESKPPHAVSVYALSNTAISSAQVMLEDLLKKWFTCNNVNHFPAYPDSVQDIDAPEWYYKSLEATG